MVTIDWETLGKYIAVLANVAVILGIPMFFYQQHLTNAIDAEKVTLSYVTRFQDNDFIKARFALFNEWSAFPVGAMHADLEAARDFVQKDMVARRRLKDLSVDEALFRLEAFFAELAQCIDKNICSWDISQTYFQDFAQRVICLYEPQFVDVERTFGVKGFGNGLRRVARYEGHCNS